MSSKYDCLKLENQICFPLYVVSKEVIRKYTPLLEELDLTYTQYICKMALWDKKVMNVKDLGDITNLSNDFLPKSAIDRTTIRMAELIQHRLGAASGATSAATPATSSTPSATTISPATPASPTV